MRADEVGIIILMPFRDVKVLLDKMNKGVKLDDIKDVGFWYDQQKFEFHIEDAVISTSYQGKPNLEHFVLKSFFDEPQRRKIDYEDIAGRDYAKGDEAYQHAMRRFVDKHPKLKLLFTPHLYGTDFHPEKYEQTP